MHGTRMSGAYRHAHLVAFEDRFQVVTVDLPGHGSRRGLPYSHRQAVDTILSGIALCRANTAIVVGHSLGGYLTVDAAAEAPDRCKAVVLVGCSAVTRGVLTWPAQSTGLIVRFNSPGLGSNPCLPATPIGNVLSQLGVEFPGHAGNVIAAVSMGLLGYLVSNRSIFSLS